VAIYFGPTKLTEHPLDASHLDVYMWDGRVVTLAVGVGVDVNNQVSFAVNDPGRYKIVYYSPTEGLHVSWMEDITPPGAAAPGPVSVDDLYASQDAQDEVIAATYVTLDEAGDFVTDAEITDFVTTDDIAGFITASALAPYAPLASPALTGSPTVNGQPIVTGTITIPGWIEVEIDFGSAPVRSKRFTLTTTGTTASSHVIAIPSGNPATGRGRDDAEWDSLVLTTVPGTNATVVTARAIPGPVVGKRKIFYQVGA
jgi:hypothetical protein